MGQKEGMEREQVLTCTEGREPALRDRAKDSIHLPGVWWMGNISDARVLDPCLTPVCRALLHIGFPPLNACFPIRRLSLAQPEASSRKNHATRHSRRRTAERSCPMRDTREMGARMMVSVSCSHRETGWS
jgi:hypothetical protein